MGDVAQNEYGECENKEQQKSFQERLSDMPAYTMTLSQLSSFYSTLKERNEVLKNAFTAGEQYVEKITTAAKPVVWAATQSALEVAKPVVGEINDPGKEMQPFLHEFTQSRVFLGIQLPPQNSIIQLS